MVEDEVADNGVELVVGERQAGQSSKPYVRFRGRQRGSGDHAGFGIHRRHLRSPLTCNRGGGAGARPHVEDSRIFPDCSSVEEPGHRIRAEFGETRSVRIGLPRPRPPLGLIKRRLYYPSPPGTTTETSTQQFLTLTHT